VRKQHGSELTSPPLGVITLPLLRKSSYSVVNLLLEPTVIEGPDVEAFLFSCP
jgi:hypothetical protein